LCENYGNLYNSDATANTLPLVKDLLLKSDPINPEAPLTRGKHELIEDGDVEVFIVGVQRSPQEEQQLLYELQQLLLDGKMAEAYNFALQYKMWPHALLLGTSHYAPSTIKLIITLQLLT
jgi:hypothetical protein